MKQTQTATGILIHLGAYLLPLIAVLIITPCIGAESIDIVQAIKGFTGQWSNDATILFYHRIPRVMLAMLVGGTLAMTGAAYQVVLRNPLAEPYTLGITGGASIGAVLAILFPATFYSWGIFTSQQLFALIGSFAILAFVYRLARHANYMEVYVLLLAGVTLSIISAGAIMFLRYIASPNYLMQMDRWMMGGLDVIGYKELSALFPILLPGLGILFSCTIALNHLSLGYEMATGHGVDVASVQKRVLFGGGLATAAVVSMSGPIGFVGLIIPHAVRRLSGYDHRIVLPASFILGASFLILCDTIARTILSPTEIPVGIITAIIGGPIFIRILLSRR